jgi:hypothetical protein
MLFERNKKMTNSLMVRNSLRIFIFCAILSVLVALPSLTGAQSSTSVSIVNNSDRQIRHVYLSHVNSDDWGADQLNNSTIAPGQSTNISNPTCDAQQIRVIAEDQDGCFSYAVVACGANSTWTITNSTVVDCGT